MVSMVGILVGAVLGMVLVAASGADFHAELAGNADRRALVSYTGRILHAYRLDEALELSEQTLLRRRSACFVCLQHGCIELCRTLPVHRSDARSRVCQLSAVM